MSHQPYEPPPGGGELPAPDAHRFVSEPTRRSSIGMLKSTLITVVVIASAIGVGAYFAKDAIRGWNERRAEREKARKEQTASAEARKGKTFAQQDPPAPNASATRLPQGFGQPTAASLTTPIPLASGGPNRPQPGGQVAAAAPRSALFVSEREAQESGLSTPAGAAQASAPTAPYLASQAAPARPAASGPFPTIAAPPAATLQDVARASRMRAGAVTSTPQVSAVKLGDRGMLLARGSYVPCGLETDLDSNVPGPANCVVSQAVYSDDGRVVLIEQGAKVQGEYKSSMKQGDRRIEVIWKRIRTSHGAIDVESPLGDERGAIGATGEIDNHWMQRIGAAFMLSLVQDAVSARAAGEQSGGTTVNTGNTTKSMAEKVLDSTINIPPTLYKRRGERVMIMVNRDLWFDGVYALERTQR